MATLAKRGGKTPSFEIQFYPDGQSSKRSTIYLGGRRYTEKTANEVKDIVERIIHIRDNGLIPDKKTIGWLEAASPEIREKLGSVGLIEVPKTHTVKELWDAFLKQKTGVKESTLEQYGHAKSRFLDHFKENRPIAELDKDQFSEWKAVLLRTLKPATVAAQMKQTKTVFNWAVASGWLEKSPLDGVGRGSFVNKSKDRFIAMEEYGRLLDACPCKDWRAILALVRIGGLRCPSEVVALRWEDVNWERNCFFVRSPKTEHHDGGESRIVPIFPELKTELEELFFDPDSEGRERVINRYRDPKQNLGTTFAKIVTRAGLPAIPRPFDNMRMTRSNEVYNRFGAFKESQWIGHSNQVRTDHYLMIQDADYQEAALWGIPARSSAATQSEKRGASEHSRLDGMLTG